MKELEETERAQGTVNENSNSNAVTNTIDDDDDGIRAPRSSRSLLGLTWLNNGLANGHHSPGRDSDRDGYNPRSARQILPPLEDSPRSVGGGKEKRRNKQSRNKIGVNDNGDYDLDDSEYNSNITQSVSRIQVESVHQNEDDSNELVCVSSRRDPFRNSEGRYKQESDEDPRLPPDNKSKKKGKKKKPQLSSDNNDGFDTLRLSQHLDDVDMFRVHSPTSKPPLTNGK